MPSLLWLETYIFVTMRIELIVLMTNDDDCITPSWAWIFFRIHCSGYHCILECDIKANNDLMLVDVGKTTGHLAENT